MPHPPEVEAKILETTEAEMLPRLTKLGFKPYFEGILKAQWLINPANGEKLRVREETNTLTGESIVMVEHKEPVWAENDQIKSNEETGYEARDFEAVIATNIKIGLMKEGIASIKTRISYVLNYSDPENKVRLDFDTYSNLMGKPIPGLLEIEATNDEKVYETARALGFQKTDCRSFKPRDLFKYYYPEEEML